MVQRLPGFTFDAGQNVRGFAGAAGNVLINGQRPSSKSDSLEDILKRIPAASVARIALIRGGVPGLDMEGRTVLADVVLREEARTDIAAEANFKLYGDGRAPPVLKLDVERRNGERALSGSILYAYEEGDDAGRGRVADFFPSGAPEFRSRVRSVDIDKSLKVEGAAQSPAWGGLFHLNGSFEYAWTGKNEQDRPVFSADGAGAASISDHYRTSLGELGADYDRRIGQATELKLVFLQTLKWRHYASEEADQTLANFAQRRFSGESILRATVTRTISPSLSVETGAEGAFNFLDGRSTYVLFGVPTRLPNDNATVQERRGEVFATATWRLRRDLDLEAGARIEASSFAHTGDVRQTQSFLFPKPRVVLTWSPGKASQLRLRFEREVGQLDFANFVASTDFTTGAVDAGNGTLQPERRWVSEAALEQRFPGDGAVVVTLSHIELQDVVDLVPIQGLNAPGNIGDGWRNTAELAVTAPLDRIGLAGGQVKFDGTWLESRVTDPTTRQARTITADLPFSGTISLTGEAPALKSTWTINVTNGSRSHEYRIDEVLGYRVETAADVRWEYKPSDRLAILFEIGDITGRGRYRSSTAYAGLRGAAPILVSEQFGVRWPAYWHIRIRRTW
ncbi:TonB-dependent receptor plug domain-containing protein [Phenylobacterium montanum]|uniref:TonB-dependent receptor n=1 Tax=Phenylobacterium montanum TaxID=2823693 RepID=A0A975IUQ9_9CAUL|nr:TonB-dependent receptor [Caulobacter sp. S6]QUD88217.1 TonB-dependent receptor [Caulobacter sp. S6]